MGICLKFCDFMQEKFESINTEDSLQKLNDDDYIKEEENIKYKSSENDIIKFIKLIEKDINVKK